jgi:hypothetical protein
VFAISPSISNLDWYLVVRCIFLQYPSFLSAILNLKPARFLDQLESGFILNLSSKKVVSSLFITSSLLLSFTISGKTSALDHPLPILADHLNLLISNIQGWSIYFGEDCSMQAFLPY